MDINYEAIGKRIKFYRQRMSLTQAKLSEIANIEPSNISHIERGATKASFPTLLSIANALNVSLDDLVYENIKDNQHISNKNLNELLADCTNEELIAIIEMTKTLKKILRTSQKR